MMMPPSEHSLLRSAQDHAQRIWFDLPQGHLLEGREWVRRHRGIVWLMWLHAIGLPTFGLVTVHHV